MIDGSGETRYGYHPAGGPGGLQLAVEDGPSEDDTIGYGYDALGRLGRRQVGAAEERWSYDALGRIGAHRNPLGVFGYTYLGDSGQVTGELLEGVPVAQWRYLDNAGDRRLAEMAYPGGAGARALRSDAYRILGIAEGDWVRLYRYDAKDRLLLAADVNRAQESGRLDRVRATRGVLYRYDAADNLLQGRTLPTQINALNQLRRWAGEDLAYDATATWSRTAAGATATMPSTVWWRCRCRCRCRMRGRSNTGSAMTAWAGASGRAATTASAASAGVARASAGCATAAAA
ncbi:MAG: hypothetical protein ACOY5H_00190 [Pseudomonadota bacterium]